MLQLGRFSARGTGGIVVCGPMGMCCVEPDLTDSAADVVWGRADIGQWLSQMVDFGRSVVFFDFSGGQPYLMVFGGAWMRGCACGTRELQAWSAPISTTSILYISLNSSFSVLAVPVIPLSLLYILK